MNRLFLALAFFSFFSIECVTNQELFLQANNACKTGDYKKALDLYQSLSNKGWAVWYNIGNCWFQLENYPEALLYWNKAVKECDSAFVPQIHENMQKAYEKLSVDSEASKGNVRSMYKDMPLIFLQFLFIAILFLVGLCAPLLIRNKRFYMLGCAMSLLCTSGGSVWHYYHQQSMQQGMIMKSFDLATGTDLNFSRCGTISQGTLVTIVSNQGEWYKVKGKNHAGWIPRDCVGLI